MGLVELIELSGLFSGWDAPVGEVVFGVLGGDVGGEIWGFGIEG